MTPKLGPAVVAAAALLAGLLALVADPAQAAGPPAPPAGTHLMLDTATTPPLSTIQAWQASSPYSAIAVYVPVDSSFDDRHDKVQANLKPSWVSAVRAGGWQVLPIYLGRQAPDDCTGGSYHYVSMKPAKAEEQGRDAAADAAKSVAALGISAGAPIVYDMEAYVHSAGCSAALRAFYDGWTTGLHGQGRLSGIYGSRASTIADVAALPSAGQAAPDIVWVATASGMAQTASLPPLPAGSWAGRRLNQFNLGVTRTYANLPLNLDESAVDDSVWDTTAPTVTVPSLPLAVRNSKLSFGWSASDGDGSGIARFQIRTKDGKLGKSLGGWGKPKDVAYDAKTAKLKAGEQWCVQVRATDRAGNTSGWSATRCTSRLADDRVLSAGRGWHRTKSQKAFKHTASVARHKSVALSTGKVSARSVGVLFRGTGTLVVKIGGHKVGAVHGTGLAWLRLGRVQHGRLQLKTKSKHKVAVDGLALLRQ